MLNEKGQSLVEFALSFVVLMFLLVGIAEFGIIFFQYIQLRDAAQEGALYGSICDCAEDDIAVRARASSDKPINLEDAVVDVFVENIVGTSKPVEDACEGDAMTVRVSYAHRVFMPFLPKIIGESIILNGIVTDTVLSPVCP